MQFDILTIFPAIFDSYFAEGILKRAQKNKIIQINVHNLRQWAKDKHKTVDDTPYGGGAGMVLKVEPIFKALKALNNFQFPISNFQSNSNNKNLKILKTKNQKLRTRIILFSAKGKILTQTDVRRLAKYDRIIMICGRYEGVDERVVKNLVDEEISIGQYVLTGGEIPAMVLVDSISRLIPGVLGNKDSLKEESYSSIQNSIIEYPHYTKPEVFLGWKVPRVLLSGHHEKIEKWRKKHSQVKSR